MEDDEIAGAGNNVNSWCWWALASTAQLAWGVSSYRKGFPGDSHFMPFKAFGVATLFIGSAASATVAALRASDVKKAEDLILAGANLRARLGIVPRGQENCQEESE
ncbi:uncharacterized protein [Euphorbia lathyris]|uniref:uncharacterized protein isoform X3 n=1 Tax=Euphorbia lathyris TaxID=212925 RepID=UPI003313EEB8